MTDPTPPDFDPLLCAHALETVAAFAELAWEPEKPIPAESPMMSSAAAILRTGKAGLEHRFGRLDAFAGDAILDAVARECSLPLDVFVTALRTSASLFLGASEHVDNTPAPDQTGPRPAIRNRIAAHRTAPNQSAGHRAAANQSAHRPVPNWSAVREMAATPADAAHPPARRASKTGRGRGR